MKLVAVIAGMLVMGALAGAAAGALFLPARDETLAVRSAAGESALGQGQPDGEGSKRETDAGAALDDRAREPVGDRAYVNVGRQIVVPVVRGRETIALIMFEFAVDVPARMTETVHAESPRLRDAFLRELFRLSYVGSFDDTYTDDRVIGELRRALRSAARQILGEDVAEVLLLDMVRQELPSDQT